MIPPTSIRVPSHWSIDADCSKLLTNSGGETWPGPPNLFYLQVRFIRVDLGQFPVLTPIYNRDIPAPIDLRVGVDG